MTSRWLVAAVVLASCRAPCAASETETVGRQLAAMGMEFSQASAADVTYSEKELDRISSNIREAMARRPNAEPVTVLNEAIFDSLGFEREVDDTDLRFVLLPSVLQVRRGSCVGLGSLYLALGERLHLPLEGVMLPGHFFVRFHDRDRVRNIELLRRGEELPDDWYHQRFPLPPEGAHEYARALSPGEVGAIVAYDIGNERRRQGRLGDARHAYEFAAARFSEFAEAQASLGAIHQLLGDLDAAEARYAAARRANPALLGLDRNTALLERERERARLR